MEVVGSLVGKVVDSLFGVAKKEISYAWNCSENVENLQKEAEKLSGMKGRVQQQIDLAKFKGELLLDGLEEWMKEADSKISDATEFINEEARAKKTCFNLRFCVNLGTLRHYSEIATKKMLLLRIHEQDGESFETRVSLPAPTPRFVDLYQRKILENIETQESALKMITEAIEDDTIQIVGIVGLGGVGKTTLASEAAAKMKNQFEDIVFIAVSQNVNAKMIQEKVQAAASKIIKGEKKISLMGNQIQKLPNHEVNFPHLDTFLIQDNQLLVVDDEFFQGMEKIKVLDMSYNHISSLPQSLKQLRELVMLDLSGNRSLIEICILGELTCLEILKLSETGITNIPKEIGQLTSLRLIDVSFCEDLSYVAPGVISNLIWLEELYFHMKMGNCNSLAELSELKSLKILHLIVPDLDCIPEDFQYDTLIDFYISNTYYWSAKHHSKRMLHIINLSPPFTMQVMKLIRLCEILRLSLIDDLDNILPDLYLEGFDELKCIDLRLCHKVRRLVKTCDLDALQICVTSNELCHGKTKGKLFSRVEEINLQGLDRLEVLWDSPHQYISFSNLRIIDISYCSSLLELFPVSVARGLVNLKELDIYCCESLVVVVSAEAEQSGGSEIELVNKDPDIVFSLTDIHLKHLPKLESFYSGRSIIKYPSLKFIEAYKCPSMKRWSYGDNHIPNIKFKHEMRQCNNINDYIAIRHEENGSWWISKEGLSG